QFIIKVYEIKAVQKKSDDKKQIYSAAVSGRLGEFHATVPDAFKPMSAVIGVEIGGTFRELVESNHVNIPSFAVLGLKDDFFSTGAITLQTEKPKEEEEASKGQSEAFNKEIEIASQLLDIRSKDTQSIELLMGLLEKFRNFSSEDRALLDIIKRFYEARAEDVRLLQMFLEFLKILGVKDGNKKSILEYFERLKDPSAASGSSGSFSEDKEAGK
ncbi:MAG: hypothetical protein HQK92_05160, partial [Nitrospirae bacterium]|nr:hypothetical protein [Nitrospirota bacterium]